MLDAILARLKQGHHTVAFPKADPVLPERYCGLPVIGASPCPPDCAKCKDVCPTGAIESVEGGPRLDLGRCLFCSECAKACSQKTISFSREFRQAATERDDLIVDSQGRKPAVRARDQIRRLFGRSLKLRQVSAGGCNACEADVNVLNTIVFDLSRFGIQFVASPRHADGLLITGPVSRNMGLALEKTYEAIAAPKIVIAVGACAISGGLFHDSEQTCGGAASVLPVDLYIPGCPPHPTTILDGLLQFLGITEASASCTTVSNAIFESRVTTARSSAAPARGG